MLPLWGMRLDEGGRPLMRILSLLLILLILSAFFLFFLPVLEDFELWLEFWILSWELSIIRFSVRLLAVSLLFFWLIDVTSLSSSAMVVGWLSTPATNTGWFRFGFISGNKGLIWKFDVIISFLDLFNGLSCMVFEMSVNGLVRFMNWRYRGSRFFLGFLVGHCGGPCQRWRPPLLTFSVFLSPGVFFDPQVLGF